MAYPHPSPLPRTGEGVTGPLLRLGVELQLERIGGDVGDVAADG